MKKLNLENIGILAGALAIGYMLYWATKPASGSGYISTGQDRNTDGAGYVKTFQDDSALIEDFGMIRT